jgi:hypothetical protein
MPSKKIIIISISTILVVLIGLAVLLYFNQKNSTSNSNSKSNSNQSLTVGQQEDINLDKDPTKSTQSLQKGNSKPSFGEVAIDPKTPSISSSSTISLKTNESNAASNTESQVSNQDPNNEVKDNPSDFTNKELTNDDNTGQDSELAKFVDDGVAPIFAEISLPGAKTVIEDLVNFKVEKFKDIGLIELEGFFPNEEEGKHLFTKIDGNREFLGYGVDQVFDLNFAGNDFHMIVLRDITSKPFFMLTDKDFGNQTPFTPEFDLDSGTVTQINNTVFRFDGYSTIELSPETKIDKEVDLVNLYIFNPED